MFADWTLEVHGQLQVVLLLSCELHVAMGGGAYF